MTKIIFTGEHDHDDFQQSSSILWKVNNYVTIKALKQFSIGGFVVLILGIITRTIEEPTNPFIFIGIVILIISLFYFTMISFAKRQYMRKIQIISNRYDKIKLAYRYEFTDDSVKYSDNEKLVEYKWSVFSTYSFYKEYLLIGLSDYAINYYIFKENEDPDYDQLKDLVISKLNERPIK